MQDKRFYPLVFFIYSDAINNKIQFVTRTGTGTTGSSDNPCSLTFNFAPYYVWYMFRDFGAGPVSPADTTYSYIGVTMSNVSTSYTSERMMSQNGADIYIKKSSDEKSIYWYGASADKIYNSNIIYAFLGIA